MLAWAVRSEPTFPGTDPSDQRADLVQEILRVMFALGGSAPKSDPSNNNDDAKATREEENMTKIGVILCDLLHLDNSDVRVYGCKLAAVALLMDAPADYSRYLVVNDAIRPLLTVLDLQVTTVVVERTTGGRSRDASALVPILIVLNKLSMANPNVKKMVKEGIFPPDAEEAFRAKAQIKMSKMRQGQKGPGAKNMSPLNAPQGTLRWKLIRLMTWHESNVKRLASELIWTLCDENSTEYVLRTGFGNAIHMLGIKGFVDLPKGSSIG